MIAIFCLLGLMVGISILLFTPPTYQANALVQIEDTSPALVVPKGLADLIGSSVKSSSAEMELLHARLTLATAVSKMNLDWVAKPISFPIIGYAITKGYLPLPNWKPFNRYARTKDSITLSFLKVPPEWLGLPIELIYDGSRHFVITLPDQTTLSGQVELLLTNPASNFAVKVHEIKGGKGRAFVLQQLSELTAVDLVSKNLAYVELGNKTGVIRVTFNGPDPDITRRTLDAILNAFRDQNLSRSSAEAEKSLNFVQSQIPAAKANQQSAENALNAYRTAQKSLDLTFETQSLLKETQTIEGKLRELSQSEEDAKRKYTPDHPVYKQLLETRKALQGRLNELHGQIARLPETQKEILNLSRNLASTQAISDALVERAQELSVLKASTIGNVRIVDPAVTPLQPVAPVKFRVMSVSLLLGILAGFAAVLLRERMRRGIGSASELEALHIPMFATISLHLTKDNKRGNAPPSDLLSRDHPKSIILEEFKSLRTNLHFGMLDAKNQSLAVTSGAPGTGKSFISANIAAISASAEFKVCLVDADMRRGIQRLRFGFKRSLPGLSEYLSGDMAIDQVLHATNIAGLTFLPTGEFPPNPSELLMRDRFKEMVELLVKRFDLVVVDCPPILAVTDAAVIGRSVGATFIVARHLITEIGQIAASKAKLEASGVIIKGAILNAFDRRRLRGYHQSGANDGYGYEYSYAYRTIEEESD